MSDLRVKVDFSTMELVELAWVLKRWALRLETKLEEYKELFTGDDEKWMVERVSEDLEEVRKHIAMLEDEDRKHLYYADEEEEVA